MSGMNRRIASAVSGLPVEPEEPTSPDTQPPTDQQDSDREESGE